MIGNHQVQIVVNSVAKTLAARASAHRIVKTEESGFRSNQLNTTMLACKLFAEKKGGRRWVVGSGLLEDYFPAFAVADFGGVDQTLMQMGRDYETVHQCEDWLGEIDIEQGFRGRELEDLSVLIETGETLFAELEEMIAQGVRGGSMTDGEESVPARAFRLLQHALRHLIHRLAHHRVAAVRAVTASHSGVKQPQEIVAFGGRGARGAWIACSIFLANGDGRRDTVDLIHIRFFHAFQELARVGRQRFDVAPLSFGVNRIEDQ